MAEAYHSDTPRTRGDHDAPHMSPMTPAEDVRTIMINKVSWGAVLAGVVVSLVTQLILNMLGIGFGAATLDPATGTGPTASTFSMGAGIWWTASGVIAALVGGYIAGRLAGTPKESTAAWHGLTSWAVATLVIFYLLTSTLGGILGGAYRTVTGAVGNVSSAVGSTAQTAAQIAAPNLPQVRDPFTAIEESIRGGGTGATDPAALRDAAVNAVRAAVTGSPAQAQEARDRAAEALSRAQGIPLDQARAQIQQYEAQYRQTVDQVTAQATQAADAAADAVAQGALFAGIGLLLGALASWFGGRMGAVDPTMTGHAATYPSGTSATTSTGTGTGMTGGSATRRT